MKKFISVALASVMVVAMAAGCSSSKQSAPAETEEQGTEAEKTERLDLIILLKILTSAVLYLKVLKSNR